MSYCTWYIDGRKTWWDWIASFQAGWMTERQLEFHSRKRKALNRVSVHVPSCPNRNKDNTNSFILCLKYLNFRNCSIKNIKCVFVLYYFKWKIESYFISEIRVLHWQKKSIQKCVSQDDPSHWNNSGKIMSYSDFEMNQKI
jgi:hypothetical protein